MAKCEVCYDTHRVLIAFDNIGHTWQYSACPRCMPKSGNVWIDNSVYIFCSVCSQIVYESNESISVPNKDGIYKLMHIACWKQLGSENNEVVKDEDPSGW